MSAYDTKTANFISALVQNMPELTDEDMKKLSNPQLIKSLLKTAFHPLEELRLYPRIWKRISLGGSLIPIPNGLARLAQAVSGRTE